MENQGKHILTKLYTLAMSPSLDLLSMLSSVPYVYPMAIAANAKYGINPVSIAYAYTMDQMVPRMLCLPTFYAML
jgi:hypothetical protein